MGKWFILKNRNKLRWLITTKSLKQASESVNIFLDKTMMKDSRQIRLVW